MQSAFVDIGLDRDAFLYVSDFFEDNDEYDKIVTSVEEKVFKQQSAGAVPLVAMEQTESVCRSGIVEETPVEAATLRRHRSPPAGAPAQERRDDRGSNRDRNNDRGGRGRRR